MVGSSARAQAILLLQSATEYEKKEPIYSLLLCRQAAEAFLMQKHLEMIDGGVAKEVLTLGDASNPKLGLQNVLSPLEKMSIQYIQNATNPFLHFRLEPLELNENLVPRVLQEVRSLIGSEDKKSKTRKPRKESRGLEDWRVVLKSELDRFDWPNVEDTIFGLNWLKEKRDREIRHLDGHKKGHQTYLNKLNFDYNSWTVAELKEKLAKQNLKTSGKKADLIARFVEHLKGTGMNKHRLHSLAGRSESTIRGFDIMLGKSRDERQAMLEKATESGLITLYNEMGGKKIGFGKHLSKKHMQAFWSGVNSVLPFDLKSGTHLFTTKKKWKNMWTFIFIIQKKGVWKLRHDWKFSQL